MIINSILDTDLYKLTMAQAIAHHFPRVEAEYTFIDRDTIEFPIGFAEKLHHEVEQMSKLSLTSDEEYFLRERCYFLNPSFVDFLRAYRLIPAK